MKTLLILLARAVVLLLESHDQSTPEYIDMNTFQLTSDIEAAVKDL